MDEDKMNRVISRFIFTYNSTYVRSRENVIDTFWNSYMRSIDELIERLDNLSDFSINGKSLSMLNHKDRGIIIHEILDEDTLTNLLIEFKEVCVLFDECVKSIISLFRTEIRRTIDLYDMGRKKVISFVRNINRIVKYIGICIAFPNFEKIFSCNNFRSYLSDIMDSFAHIMKHNAKYSSEYINVESLEQRRKSRIMYSKTSETELTNIEEEYILIYDPDKDICRLSDLIEM